jgi:hypothetical protein
MDAGVTSDPFGKTLIYPIAEEVLVDVVRRAPNLRWFRGNLTPEIAMLQRELPARHVRVVRSMSLTQGAPVSPRMPRRSPPPPSVPGQDGNCILFRLRARAANLASDAKRSQTSCIYILFMIVMVASS